MQLPLATIQAGRRCCESATVLRNNPKQIMVDLRSFAQNLGFTLNSNPYSLPNAVFKENTMSTASVHAATVAQVRPISYWVQRGLNILQAAFATSPAQAAPKLSRHQEAEQLRNYACSVMQDDPSYADDLFAAADRHEFG
jgi:Iap family predicted aminopeptidase